MKPDFKRFADELLAIAWQGSSADGAEIQEIALACGLLKEVRAAKPCGEHCNCAEYGADFPTTCYRKTYKSE